MKTPAAASTSCSSRSSGIRRGTRAGYTDRLGQSSTPGGRCRAGGGRAPPLGSPIVVEDQIRIARLAGFAAAALAAVLLQRLAPHTRARGSWRVNTGLWLVNTALLGAVCGACACTVAGWAAREGFGLLNLLHV